MVFYLKYRPQKIEELDNPNVRDTLKAVLSSSETKKGLSFHAFLFTGPKGLGKTSAARIVAKFLNCEKRKAGDLEPCNKCYQCTSITAGNNLDIVEIDAASNRGIDEIRELKEKINLSTVSAKYKVYIIDEVHMMTNEAFNALLKTLEEPPSHAVFVLCTTDPQKVPATIVSRCLQISFKRATEEELIRSFKRIISGEKLNIDKDALESIAKLSDGTFRDGAKILQELNSKAGNKKITKEIVEENFKTESVSSYTSQMISFLEGKDTKKALDLIQKMVEEGVGIKYFMESLVSELHVMLLAKVEEKGETKFSLSEIKKLLELLMEASSQIKYAVLPQLPLELAVVEFTAAGSPHLSELARQTKIEGDERSSSLSEGLHKSSFTGKSSAGRPSVAGQMDKPSAFLKELIVKVDSQNKMVAGVLRGVMLREMNGKKIIVEARSQFHQKKLLESKTRELIEKMAGEILKKNVTIEVKLRAGDIK